MGWLNIPSVKKKFLVTIITMTILCNNIFGAIQNVSALQTHDSIPLPHTFKIAWWDQTLDDSWMTLQKEYGFQGIAKIIGAGEWTNIERKEGVFDFSKLRNSLENSWEHGFWVMPTLGLNDPPGWFIEKYPHSILKDATNQTITDYNEGGHVLSPWFVLSGEGEHYIKRFIENYLEILSDYPNVVGVFVGDHLVFNLPWYFGGNPSLEYFMCFDEYALRSYKVNFTEYQYVNPPEIYDELVNRGNQFMKDFEQWYREFAVLAIEKYLIGIGEKVKYKTINIGRVGSEADNYMIGTTVYQVKKVFDMMSLFNHTIENFEALQDTDRTIELSNWAKERGLIFGGEPAVPEVMGLDVDNLILVGGSVLFHIDQTYGVLNENVIKKIEEFNNQFPSIQTPIPYDNLPPNIWRVSNSPEFPEYQDRVFINANITDHRSGVDIVILNYYNGNKWLNITMDLKDQYISTIPELPYETEVKYRIYASDNFGNWKITEINSYRVDDNTPPNIGVPIWSPVEPSTQQEVLVNVSVSELKTASGINSVILWFRIVDDEWQSLEMTSKNGIWTAVIYGYSGGKIVEFYIESLDMVGNQALTQNYSYTVKIVTEEASPEPEPEPKPSFWDAIPGFPYESVVLGVLVGFIAIWLLRARVRARAAFRLEPNGGTRGMVPSLP